MQFQKVGRAWRKGVEASLGWLLDFFLKVPLISAEVQMSRSLTLQVFVPSAHFAFFCPETCCLKDQHFFRALLAPRELVL